MRKKRVFVTVGTTKFEQLIEAASTTRVLDSLQKLGYEVVQYQTGNGIYEEKAHEHLELIYNKYFDNFDEEIEKSDLVISHAGAGTCIEVLRKHKPLIVVINTDLMDNHQTELAEQLQSDGYLYYCTCASLENMLTKDFSVLKKYRQPNLFAFPNYLHKCMGF